MAVRQAELVMPIRMGRASTVTHMLETRGSVQGDRRIIGLPLLEATKRVEISFEDKAKSK